MASGSWGELSDRADAALWTTSARAARSHRTARPMVNRLRADEGLVFTRCPRTVVAMPTPLRPHAHPARLRTLSAVALAGTLALTACSADEPASGAGTAGDVTEATLEITGGSYALTLATGETDGQLFRAESGTSGLEPVATETAPGRYELDFTFADGATESEVTVYLDPEVLWHLDLSGGANTLTADLAEGRVGSIDLLTGVATFDLTLPEPESEVAITQSGGLSEFAVHLPAAAGAEVSFSGGFGAATVDGEPLAPGPTGEAVAGDVTAEHYVITNTGGLASFVLDRTS